MKKLLSALFIVSLVISVLGIGYRIFAREKPSPDTRTLPVVATFYPHAFFAQAVGGDLVSVKTLVPPGSEPHDYDPSPRDIAALNGTKVFIFNGAGIERWTDKVISSWSADSVQIVNASETVELQADERNLLNPHYWLDPIAVQKEIDSISVALTKADPLHQSAYEQNAATMIQRLLDLDNHIRSELSSCTNRTVIASHDAFGYFARRYMLTVVPISGLSPDEEPSPARMAEIADFARANSVKYIFFESLVSPRLSDTIAQEVGAQTLVFNPLEGLTEDEIRQGKDYFTVQEENVRNLKIALGC